MAKKSELQIWAEYAAARTVLGFFGVMPRRMSLRLGAALGRAAFHGLKGPRRTGMRSLEIAFPEKSVQERERILKGSFESFGRVLAELGHLPRATRESLDALVEYEFETAESLSSPERIAFEAERAKGRGVILIGPHLGNPEIGVFAYSAREEPVSYLARRMDNPLLEDYLTATRQKFGNRSINKTNSIGQALKILGEGGVLGVLPDVNAHPKEGVFVPFFGVEACTTAGVAMLAVRTDAMIVSMCCIWDVETQKYHAYYGNLVEAARTGDRHRDIVETTAAYTAELEAFIRSYPDQYLWTHRRWKTRPPGEDPLY